VHELLILLVQIHDLLEGWNLEEVLDFHRVRVIERRIYIVFVRLFAIGCKLVLAIFCRGNVMNA
jgi:hypothetical protein